MKPHGAIGKQHTQPPRDAEGLGQPPPCRLTCGYTDTARPPSPHKKERLPRKPLFFVRAWGGFTASEYSPVQAAGWRLSGALAVSRWYAISPKIASCGVIAVLRWRLCGRGSGYAGRDGRKSPVVRTSAKAPCRAAMNASCTVAAGMVFPFHDRSRVAQASCRSVMS